MWGRHIKISFALFHLFLPIRLPPPHPHLSQFTTSPVASSSPMASFATKHPTTCFFLDVTKPPPLPPPWPAYSPPGPAISSSLPLQPWHSHRYLEPHRPMKLPLNGLLFSNGLLLPVCGHTTRSSDPPYCSCARGELDSVHVYHLWVLKSPIAIGVATVHLQSNSAVDEPINLSSRTEPLRNQWCR